MRLTLRVHVCLRGESPIVIAKKSLSINDEMQVKELADMSNEFYQELKRENNFGNLQIWPSFTLQG